MNRITATLLCLMLCLAGTGIPTASAAINLEQSTATLTTQLSQTTATSDVANAIALIKTTSLGSRTSAFAAEQTTVATPPTTPTTPITPPATPAHVVPLETPLAAPPLTRPFPAPVTTRTVTVPATIDATGASDVSTALQSFISSVPNGSLINFPSTAVYRLDRTVELFARHNLILDGNGCTLKYTSITGTKQEQSLLHDSALGGSDIWIRNFVLIGSSPYPGVYTPGDSPTGGEGQHGVAIISDRTEVSGCTVSAVWGDGFYVGNGTPVGVWIHDNHVISAGRNGVSVISGSDILVEDCAFDASGYLTFDVEANIVSQASSNVTFRNNIAGTWGIRGFLALGSTAGAPVDRVVVDGNTVKGGSIRAYVGNGKSTDRMTRITFTNNKGTIVAGPVISASHIDGLTITGNVQPLSSGVLASIADSTGG